MTTTYTVYGADGYNAAADEYLFAEEELVNAEKSLDGVRDEVAANIAEAMKPEEARAAKIKQEEERLASAEARFAKAWTANCEAYDRYEAKLREYQAFLARPAFA